MRKQEGHGHSIEENRYPPTMHDHSAKSIENFTAKNIKLI